MKKVHKAEYDGFGPVNAEPATQHLELDVSKFAVTYDGGVKLVIPYIPVTLDFPLFHEVAQEKFREMKLGDAAYDAMVEAVCNVIDRAQVIAYIADHAE